MMLSLIATACNSGADKYNGKKYNSTPVDTIAVLRMVEAMYSGDERPDSTILELFAHHLPIYLSTDTSNRPMKKKPRS